MNPQNSPQSTPPQQLLDFQRHYSGYLRAPAERPLPQGIPQRRSRIYEDLLFNNVCGFIDRCFPVSQAILGEKKWRELSRNFYRDWSCHTPYFGLIPFEFVQYAAQLTNQPPWLAELIDYEWHELEVDLHPATVPHAHLPADDQCPLQLNPTLQNLQYRWPVQCISPEFIPEQEQATFLLVYRRFDHRVQFMEINAVTHLLLHLLAEGPQSPQTLLANLAEQLPQLPPATLTEFGRPLLRQLLEQNVLTIG